VNPKLICLGFINQADSAGTNNEEAREIIQECGEIKCLPFSIGQRKIFDKSASEGLSILEFPIPDKKASAELMILYDAVFSYST
jgi:hypothetical protein